MPIPQKSGCGRPEVAITPEYLRTRMNYRLLLRDPMGNGDICCFFHGRTAMSTMPAPVPQAPARRQSHEQQQQPPAPAGEAPLGAVAGSGQKNSGGDACAGRPSPAGPLRRRGMRKRRDARPPSLPNSRKQGPHRWADTSQRLLQGSNGSGTQPRRDHHNYSYLQTLTHSNTLT